MERKTPKVTIGLAVYNGEKYLGDALESILSQTFGDFEVVISDNGSTDDTAEICRTYARRDRRVRYYRQLQNSGAAWNYNRVLELARGEYFKWMAHDDVIAPRFLAACVAALDAQPDVVWCQTQIVLIDSEGQPLAGNINAWNDPSAPPHMVHSVQAFDPGGRRGERSSPAAHKRFLAVLLGAAWALDCYGLIRSDALRRTRGHLPIYGSEKILVGELSLIGRYGEVPQPLVMIRIHEGASGGLTETAQQQEFMGKKSTSWVHPRLQLLLGHMVSPLRASLPLGERVRCFGVVAHYLFQVHKWWGVARSLFSRQAGNGNQLFLSNQDDDAADENAHQEDYACGRSAANAPQHPGDSAWMVAVTDQSLPFL